MTDRPNVLFISIDDLRPELHSYGCAHIHSPHLDTLAAAGRRFDRCYCQVPVCGASRASTMSGLRPLPDRFVTYFTTTHEDAPSTVTLPEHLRRQGYYTVSRGKVFHHRVDSPAAWSEPAWRPPHEFPGYIDPDDAAYQQRMLREEIVTGEQRQRGPAWEVIDTPLSCCPDHQTADYAIAELSRLSRARTPFFLAAGFVRPHLPFIVPRRFWELYDRDDLPLPPLPEPPTDVPPDAWHNSPELRKMYRDIPDIDPIGESTTRLLRHGYFAAVSFLDHEIGRLLGALDDLGLTDDTIIMFTVDHGWNLGEHGLWCKHCLYETSLRIPLIVRAPGVTPGPTRALVDNLDIYPTLCDLLDLPRPDHELPGRSMVPLLDDPTAAIKDHSLSRYHHGESVRTDRYRYSEWRRDGRVVGRTLFDHASDPDEGRNLADDPAHGATATELAELLPARA